MVHAFMVVQDFVVKSISWKPRSAGEKYVFNDFCSISHSVTSQLLVPISKDRKERTGWYNNLHIQSPVGMAMMQHLLSTFPLVGTNLRHHHQGLNPNSGLTACHHLQP